MLPNRSVSTRPDPQYPDLLCRHSYGLTAWYTIASSTLGVLEATIFMNPRRRTFDLLNTSTGGYHNVVGV
jgi:hypothetical protein